MHACHSLLPHKLVQPDCLAHAFDSLVMHAGLRQAGLGAQGSSESLTELMEQLAVHFPTLTRPLIGERDEYMAFRLRMLASKCGPTGAQAHGPRGRPLLAVRSGVHALEGARASASCTHAHSRRASLRAFLSDRRACLELWLESWRRSGIHESDCLLCGRAARVVAVVGAGHVPGTTPAYQQAILSSCHNALWGQHSMRVCAVVSSVSLVSSGFPLA